MKIALIMFVQLSSLRIELGTFRAFVDLKEILIAFQSRDNKINKHDNTTMNVTQIQINQQNNRHNL